MKFTTNILNELAFITSRSSGKGGQHVNKTETRVTLIWDFEASENLSELQKDLIRERAKSYLKGEKIQFSDENSRSQVTNKENCIKRLDELLTIWLKVEKKRKPTKIPKSVIRKRLNDKKRKSEVKQNRKKPEI